MAWLWTVDVAKKAAKSSKQMPLSQRALLETLIDDLETTGPVQGAWPNYSKLGKNVHHCHLSPKWVVCWEVVDKQVRILNIYYVGSRKDAPY